jgi:predicted MPP superfamily phosphohydrolase
MSVEAPQPRHLIFRFSDLKKKDNDEPIPTIARHRETAEASGEGKVWWGWWKKGSETSKAPVFEAFHKSIGGPTDVGLVHRTLEPDEWASKLYVATCHEVAWSEEGLPVESPNPDWTPDYYNTERHPAWGLLSDIRQIEREEWRNRFGIGVPLGNSTLYWTEADAWGQQFPAAPKIMDHSTKHPTILHLSDLHFGDDHAFVDDKNTPGETMAEKVLAALEQYISEPVGAVVVSGDFITKGQTDLYLKGVPEEIHGLVEKLGLNVRQHLLAVPGNHDIELDRGDEKYSQEEPYKKFLPMLLQTQEAFEDLEQGRRLAVEDADGWILTLVGFNSIKPREAVYKDYGYVGTNRVDTMFRDLGDADRTERSVVFAVLHHHLLPVEPFIEPDRDRKASLTLDAGELIEAFQAAGVDVVLHGHQHRPFIGRGDRSRREHGELTGFRDQLWILGAGSAGSKQLPYGVRNSFSVYTPTPEGLRIRIVEFGPHSATEMILDDILPFTEKVHPASQGGTADDADGPATVGDY